jgi:flagellar biosynthetic protein FliQ
MSLDQATDLVRQSMLLALLIAAPMLGVALVVGIVLSLVQAVTQIQEQTLTFIPKITAMFLAAAMLMPWIGVRLLEYTSHMFGSIMPWATSSM